MSLKSKLITCIIAFCMVIATLCVGAWALQVQTVDWGGDINFTASYIDATISKATLTGVSHVNSGDSSTKMQAVTMTSTTTTESLQANSAFNSWTNLKLKLTSSKATIKFTITNNSTNTDEYIDVNYDVDFAMEDNIEIWVTQVGSLVIAPNATSTTFTINLKVVDEEIDGKLLDFGINLDLKRLLPTDEADLHDDLSWSVYNTTEASVYGEGSTATELTVPALIKRASDGQIFPVTRLSTSFENAECESIILPNSLTRIEVDSFSGCVNLKELIIPNSVTFWGDALYGCDKLEYVKFSSNLTEFADGYAAEFNPSLKRVDLPVGLTSIGDYAFDGCTSLESIYIPSSVTSIGHYAFRNCGLTSIDLPSGLTSIGGQAFIYCPLKEVVIPDGVTGLQKGVFAYNNVIEKITVPFVGNGTLNIIRLGFLFDENAGLIDGNMNISGTPASLKTIVVTGGSQIDYYYATRIPEYAFVGNTTIETVILGEKITNIGEGAFLDCTSLKEVSIPDGIDSVESGAFAGCTSLRSIEIPKSVTYIGDGAFANCNSLESIVIPFVGFYAESSSDYRENDSFLYDFFWSGSNEDIPESLNEVTITNVTKISAEAFYGCKYIETINLPAGLKSIGESAFRECDNLKAIKIPRGVTTIPYRCFEGCDMLETIDIPDTVTTIEQSAFNSLASLESIEIPDSVTSLGSYMFGLCSSLKEVKLSKNITTISNGTFYGCTSLKRIVIPERVLTMGNQVFTNCTDITIVMLSKAPPTASSTTFTDCSNFKVIVPVGSEGAYMIASVWSDYADYIY